MALFNLAFPTSKFQLLFHVKREVMKAGLNLVSMSHFGHFAFVLRSVTHLPGRTNCVIQLFSSFFHCPIHPFFVALYFCPLEWHSPIWLSSADGISGLLISLFQLLSSYSITFPISLVNCFPAKSQVLEEIDKSSSLSFFAQVAPP